MRSLLTVSILLACAACGTRTAPAVAEPRKPRADAAPLVPESLDDDAHLAKAIREHYTKFEYEIPMRDGVRLFTVAYVPKDRTRTWPILLGRTPYGVAPYGIDNYPDEKNVRALHKVAPSTAFLRRGFIFVHQDVRGKMSSGGTFVDVRPHRASKAEIDESTDAYDTVDWLVKNVPGNSGKVGLWGISYPGFYAAQAAIDAHPAIKAISPQAPVTEWFLGDDFHHNGAFFVADAFNFYSSFGKPRPKPVKKSTWGFDYDAGDAYEFFLAMGPLPNANAKYLEDKIPFWNDILAHGTRDAWWKARDPRPFYRDAKPAIMTVGGLFDSEDLFGALETYRAFERQSPKTASNTLVLGPWRHGGWARSDGDRLGDITFGQKTSRFYQENIELPFFEKHLYDAKVEAPPEAWVFETGTNVWHAYAAWPPADVKPTALYFQAGGKLGTAAPREAGEDAYVSDPGKPVPYRAKMGQTIDGDYMTDDQRFASRRPDVLVYATGELDADVTLAGPIKATLHAATTGTDADFVVKVIDVYPGDHAELPGYQQLVRAEIMRGKFRTGFDTPQPFVPGEPAEIRFDLPDVCHAFRKGHKLMVQVQSSWFPLVDRNPQTFVDIYKAKDTDFRAATHRILRAPGRASRIEVPLQRGTL